MCGLPHSSSNVMLVTALDEYFGTQFKWHLFRYPLAFNTCNKSGYNEPIFTPNFNFIPIIHVCTPIRPI